MGGPIAFKLIQTSDWVLLLQDHASPSGARTSVIESVSESVERTLVGLFQNKIVDGGLTVNVGFTYERDT